MVIIAAIVSIPINWYFMNNWLSNFSYRTNINFWCYVIAFIAAILLFFLMLGQFKRWVTETKVLRMKNKVPQNIFFIALVNDRYALCEHVPSDFSFSANRRVILHPFDDNHASLQSSYNGQHKNCMLEKGSYLGFQQVRTYNCTVPLLSPGCQNHVNQAQRTQFCK